MEDGHTLACEAVDGWLESGSAVSCEVVDGSVVTGCMNKLSKMTEWVIYSSISIWNSEIRLIGMYRVWLNLILEVSKLPKLGKRNIW